MKEIYSEHIKPIVVLLVICLVISAALAATYAVTQPIIDAAELAAAEATRKEILPDAEGFVELECDVDNILSVYADSAGGGYVITAETSGYGGSFNVIVGLDADGRVIAVRVGKNSETVGVGSHAAESGYTDGFVGKSGSVDDVDVLSGASVTSRAIKRAVNSALAAFELIGKGGAQ